ncbi:hypothetical protein BK138_32420 [Paenibacillus rhizosphaerae]|uniref:Uncharacterized protein n=1 Tax=Paenibacillus rhizosphaerae TaxID=297318 RepID=A0A1R1E557_9BACL|nr:hypothetical protein BK138_32420 [Paenibacillus rhizosphaerae]
MKQTIGIHQEFGSCTGYCESVVFALEKARQYTFQNKTIYIMGEELFFFHILHIEILFKMKQGAAMVTRSFQSYRIIWWRFRPY